MGQAPESGGSSTSGSNSGMGSEVMPPALGPGPPLPMAATVKMKGLPFKASCEDVLKFYCGFSIAAANIYMKRHPDGRPSGEAFVVFESSDEAQRACQKDRETFGEKFGDRYVRVYPTLESDVADMQSAVHQQNMVQQGHTHVHMDSVVKMKSLPFDATQLDVITFFEEYRLKPNGVQLVVRSDNKPTGEAFVDFESYDEALRALRERDHKVFHEKFGDRYVRLIQVSRKEMQATLALRFGGEGILKVKGIPFKAGAAEVRKFFAGFRIRADGVSFIMHADGRPTGMAFIEFETPQEAVRAMERDRAKFGPEYGDRFCMLQLVGRHEMDKVQLQHEGGGGDQHPAMMMAAAAHGKLMNGLAAGLNGTGNGGAGGQHAAALNGLNGLNAAALALQALAAANPALLMSHNPWLAGHVHQALAMGGAPGGGLPQLGAAMAAAAAAGGGGAGAGPVPIPGVTDASAAAAAAQQLAAQQQLGQQLSGAGMGGLTTALNGLSLLPPGAPTPPPHNGDAAAAAVNGWGASPGSADGHAGAAQMMAQFYAAPHHHHHHAAHAAGHPWA